jgi:hypothetical protein
MVHLVYDIGRGRVRTIKLLVLSVVTFLTAKEIDTNLWKSSISPITTTAIERGIEGHATFQVKETNGINRSKHNISLHVNTTSQSLDPERQPLLKGTNNSTEQVGNSDHNTTTMIKQTQNINQTLHISPTPSPSHLQEQQQKQDSLKYPPMKFEEGLYERSSSLDKIFAVSDPSTNYTVSSLLEANNTAAVCNFRQVGSWTGFPHTFQQLLRCVSWWNVEENKNKQPILVIWNVPSTSSWTRAFLEIFQKQWNIILDRNATYQSISVYGQSPSITSIKAPSSFEVASPTDAEAMRQSFWAYYNNQTISSRPQRLRTGGCPSANTTLTNKDKKSKPVIAFLNREIQSGRHVVNYQEILDFLRDHFPSHDIRYLSSFDGTSFDDQVTFMSNIDILIGPHGAQLTNIAFMPQCGGILEIFGKGYYIPHYYGSLARSTGHYYYNVYTGTSIVKETNYYMRGKHRYEARRFNMTVDDLPGVVTTVEALIERWQKCCERGARPFNVNITKL